MARIKVTGYLDTDEMDEDHVDLNHETGLSEKGTDAASSVFYNGVPYKLTDLEDIEFELER